MSEDKRVVLMSDNFFARGELFGMMDEHLRLIEEKLKTSIVQRKNELTLMGGDVERAEKALKEMIDAVSRGEHLDKQKVAYILDLALKDESYGSHRLNDFTVCYTHMGKPINAKTIAQRRYVESLRKKDIVFGIGPAGTGKTYLAVAMAVSAFKENQVDRIILARPAVEAGERLGFLPGDLQEKVDPYLRPLYDALYEIMGREQTIRLKEKELIEVVPLAYMRGRTLDNSFIILDEAQNTTSEQMKMFLTRMGFNSKVVVTGDLTQIDLPKGTRSGLKEAVEIFENVDEVDICFLHDVDVIRNELVKKVIVAYDRYEKDKI